MTYFFCKMILPRSDFIQTMTDSERNIMKAHGDYLQSLAEVGSIVCHGPVDDPKGGWGLSIFSAKDQTEVERLTAADPIILDDVGATYEILPMKQLRMAFRFDRSVAVVTWGAGEAGFEVLPCRV